MPLFKRSAFKLAQNPVDLSPDEEVFQIEFTGEVFRDYTEYVARMERYKKKVWACKVTGKANLTYVDALESESKAIEKVQSFPKLFMKPVLQQVQFNPLSVSDMVNRFYKKYKNHFVEGEVVDCKTETGTFKVVKVNEDCNAEACRCSYEIFPEDADENEELTSTTVPGETLTRKAKFSLSKGLLKSFIRDSATCGTAKGSKWVVKEELALLHDIPQVEGLDVVEATVEVDDRKVSVKHPIDDSMLPSNTKLRPKPTSEFGPLLPMDCIGDLLTVWDFCASFSKVIKVSPFSLDEFVGALRYTEEDAKILVEVHCALLKIIIMDPNVYAIFNKGRKRAKRVVDTNVWTLDLCDVLDIKGDARINNYTTTMRKNNLEYEVLDVPAKLEILRCLMEWCIVSNLIRDLFAEHNPRSALNKRKRQAEADAAMVDNDEDEEEDEPAPPPTKKRKHNATSSGSRSRSSKKGNESDDEEALTLDDKCPLRAPFLGLDRESNRYWFFSGDGRIFVESQDSSQWSYYDEDNFHDFVKSLDCRGIREKGLKENINKHMDAIVNSFDIRSQTTEDEFYNDYVNELRD